MHKKQKYFFIFFVIYFKFQAHLFNINGLRAKKRVSKSNEADYIVIKVCIFYFQQCCILFTISLKQEITHNNNNTKHIEKNINFKFHH